MKYNDKRMNLCEKMGALKFRSLVFKIEQEDRIE